LHKLFCRSVAAILPLLPESGGGLLRCADLVALVLLAHDLRVDQLFEILEFEPGIIHVVRRAVVKQHKETKGRDNEQCDPEEFSEKCHRRE
jgi:hypothetical protein